eukprot:1880223-Rhodomonas_salina.1
MDDVGQSVVWTMGERTEHDVWRMLEDGKTVAESGVGAEVFDSSLQCAPSCALRGTEFGYDSTGDPAYGATSEGGVGRGRGRGRGGGGRGGWGDGGATGVHAVRATPLHSTWYWKSPICYARARRCPEAPTVSRIPCEAMYYAEGRGGVWLKAERGEKTKQGYM